MDKSIHSAHQRVLQASLRRLREEQGLRQEDVAERLGEPQSLISKYETGERRLDVLELRQVCAALGISLPDFVARFEENLNEARL